MAISRKIAPLGNILMQLGKISQEHLEDALKKQQSNPNVLLGDTLVKSGIVTENDIKEALAIQYNFPFLPIERYKIAPEVVKIIPGEMIEKYRFIPLEKFEDILVGVMDDPLNKEAIEQIEKYTNCIVRQFFSYAAAIDNFIKVHVK